MSTPGCLQVLRVSCDPTWRTWPAGDELLSTSPAHLTVTAKKGEAHLQQEHKQEKELHLEVSGTDFKDSAEILATAIHRRRKGHINRRH